MTIPPSEIAVPGDAATIGRTKTGNWPFLSDTNYLHIYPAYTRELVALLLAAPADIAGAINAATAAQAAATAAVASAAAAQASAAGLADTGWVPFALNAGYTWRTGYEGALRAVGPIVAMRGMANRTWAGTATIATIAAQFRPASQVNLHDGQMACYLVSSGAIVASTSSAAYLDLSHVWMR